MMTPPTRRSAFRMAAALFATALFIAAAVQGAKMPDDAVVARVGTESISRKMLVGQLAKYFGRTALQQMVDRGLLDQEAARLKVTLTDADVAGRVDEARKTAGGNFAQALEQEGISEEAWRDRVRYGLLAEKVLDKKWPVKEKDLVRFTVRYIRVQTMVQAKEVIRDARLTPFDRLADQDPSRDKGTGGLVQPEKFLRVENPQATSWIDTARKDVPLNPGQYYKQPIPSGDYFLVVKLDAEYGPETLKGKEREQAIAKVRAYRIDKLLPTLRAQWKPQFKVTGEAAWDTAGVTGDTVLAQVGDGANLKIERKKLEAYLLEYFGKAALETLIERNVVVQEAAKLRVAVSDAEVAARAASLQQISGKTAFQANLDAEGITEPAWRDRLRYSMLAEKVVGARSQVRDEDLQRMRVRYLRARSEEDAGKILDALQKGATFDQLAAQRPTDFINPNPFLRVDNPTIYKLITDARLQNGQFLTQPVKLGEAWLVLHFEARFGPETMTAKERDEALHRINATHAGEILDAVRRSYKVENVVPMKTLVADARTG